MALPVIRSRPIAAGLAAALAASTLVGLAARPASAAGTMLVDSLADVGDASPGDGTCLTADGDCTLRAAVQEANASAGIDEIVLPPGRFDLEATLLITDETYIYGPAMGAAIIDAGQVDANGDLIAGAVTRRAFWVSPGARLDLYDLTVRGGAALGPYDPVNNPGGAGILNEGTLELRRVEIAHNVTQAPAAETTAGGGLHSRPGTVLFVADSWVHDNTASGVGGGISAWADFVMVERTVIEDNTSSHGGGIAVVSDPKNPAVGGSAVLSDLHVVGNASPGGGGGLVMNRPGVIEDSMFADNAAQYGGGLHVVPDPNLAGGLEIHRVRVVGNSATDDGGGISAAERILLTNSEISGNTATDAGGGIYMRDGTVRQTSVNNNTAGQGAGISALGSLLLTDSTVANNTATTPAAPGIDLAGDTSSTPRIYRSTIAGNVGNGQNYQVAVQAAYAPVPIELSIIKGIGTTTSCSGPVTDSGADNVDVGGFCGLTNADTSDPLFAPLAWQGGYAQALLPDPATTAATGNSSDCSGVDARRVSRAHPSGTCALGAAEAGFWVSSTGDGADASVGDGNCSTSLVAVDCTLRAAIMEANALPGRQGIYLAPSLAGADIALGQGTGSTASHALEVTDHLTISQDRAAMGNATGSSLITTGAHGVFDIAAGTDFEAVQLTSHRVGSVDGGVVMARGGVSEIRLIDPRIYGYSGPGHAVVANGASVSLELRELADALIVYQSTGAIRAEGDVLIEGGDFGDTSTTGTRPYLYLSRSIDLRNAQVSHITAGGADGAAIMATGGGRIWRSTFDRIVGASDGAAIAAHLTEPLDIVDSSFTNNRAARGGAILVDGGIPTPGGWTAPAARISYSDFIDNSATTGGGAIHVSSPNGIGVGGGGFALNTVTASAGEGGGAILAADGAGPIRVGAVDFTSNEVYTADDPSQLAGAGGAIEAWGLLQSGSSDFTGNRAAVGGALAALGIVDGVLLADSQFSSNHASSQGGAVRLFTVDGPAPVGYTIDGSTFESNTTGGAGAAISMLQSELVVRDTVVANNVGLGGAISVSESVGVTITGSTLTGNAATGNGGAIDVGDTSNLAIDSSVLTGNTATGAGGAIHFVGQSASLVDTTIGGDPNLDLGNEASGSGGGVSMTALNTLVVLDSTIQGNRTTEGSGGGAHIYAPNLVILDTDILDNTSEVGNGGGADIQSDGLGNIQNVTFRGNSADGATGGGLNLYAVSGSALLDGVTADNNQAYFDGGGLFIGGPSGTSAEIFSPTATGNTSIGGPGGGMAVYIGGEIRNPTATGNDAAYGGGMFLGVGDGEVVQINGGTIQDNVSAFDGGGVLAYGGGNVTFGRYVFEQGAAGTFRLPTQVLNNTAGGRGGGIWAETDITMTAGEVAGNESTGDGGGIGLGDTALDFDISGLSVHDNVTGTIGSGISVSGDAAGSIEATAVFANTATSGGAVHFGAELTRATIMNNVTVADNVQTSNAGGGAGIVHEGGSLNVNHATIVRNTTPGGEENVLSTDGGGTFVPASLEASIVGSGCDGADTAGANVFADASPNCTPNGPVTVPDLAGQPLILDAPDADGHMSPGLGSPAVDILPDSLCLVAVPTDARGATRPIGAGCDAGAIERDFVPPSLDVTLTVEGSAQPGASIIPAGDINKSKIQPASVDDTSVDSTPLRDIPLRDVPLRDIPLRDIPLRDIPLRDISLNQPGVVDGLGQVAVSELGLLEPIPGPDGALWETWQDVLDHPGSGLNDRPAYTVSLAEVLADATVGTHVRDAALQAIDLGASPLGETTLWVLAVAGETGRDDALKLDEVAWKEVLDGVAAASTAEDLAAFCAWASAVDSDFDCASIGVVDGAASADVTMLEASIAGAPLRDIPLRDIPLRDIPLRDIPLRDIPLRDIPLRDIPLRDIPLRDIDLLGVAADDPDGTVPTLDEIEVTYTASDGSVASAPLRDIPLRDILIGDTPLRDIPLRDIPLRDIPLRDIPLRDIPLRDIPLRDIVINASPLRDIPLRDIPLRDIPLRDIPLRDIPLRDIPLRDIPLRDIPLRDILLNTTPLRDIDVSSALLSDAPLRDIPLRDIPLDVRQSMFDCSVISCDDEALTLGAAADAGAVRVDATVGLLHGLAIADANGEEISLATILYALPTDHEALDSTSYADVAPHAGDTLTLGHLWPYIDTDLETVTLWVIDAMGAGPGADMVEVLLADTTIGEMLGFGSLSFADLLLVFGETTLRAVLEWLVQFPSAQDLSLADLLIIVLGPENYPWTDADLSGGGVQAAVPDGPQVTYTAVIEVGSHPVPDDLQVRLTLPGGAYMDPSSVATHTHSSSGGVTTDVSPTLDGIDVLFTLPSVANGTATLTIPVAAPLAIGEQVGSIEVVAPLTGLVATDSAGLTVQQEFEPNDTLADLAQGTAPALADDIVFMSHIGAPGDVDLYPVTLAKGEGLSVFLGNIPEDADLDLVVYGPPDSATPGTGVDSVDADESSTQNVQDLVLLEAIPAVRISAERGTDPERADLPPVQFPGQYIVQVTGYNGAWSTSPYTLQAKVFGAPELPPCAPWPDGLTTTEATTSFDGPTAIDTSTRTLFLINRDRYAGAHDHDDPEQTSLAALDTHLRRVAEFDGQEDADASLAVIEDTLATKGTEPYVNGAILDLGALPADDPIQQAYAAWNASRCDIGAANGVALAIAEHLRQLRASDGPGRNIAHVVIVGDDAQIPFARVPDFVEISNERTFSRALGRPDGLADELLAAAAFGHYLTDDIYADAGVQVASNRPVYVPEISVGRLVESALEIEAQLEHFYDSRGRLDPTSQSFVTGYDFLADGATEIADALGVTDRQWIDQEGEEGDDLWTSQDLDERYGENGTSTERDAISINAHYDHEQLLSSREDAAGTQADTFRAEQLSGDYAGTIAFTMGCHAGLSVSDVSVGFGVGDWAQTWASNQALYVGNTGYGYGDTEIVALSEMLMANFARNLADAQDAEMTVGQAMALAKSTYAADLSVYGVYDEKVLMEATFYGLPMYRIESLDSNLAKAAAGQLGQEDGQTHDKQSPGIDPATDLPARTDVDFAIDGTTTKWVDIENDEGETYWVVEEDGVNLAPQATFDRPIQPRWTADVTAHDGVGGVSHHARGAVIEGITITTVPEEIDPVLATPIVDNSDERTEADQDDIAFPSTFTKVSRIDGPEGPIDQLVVVPGQFVGSSEKGLQTLFDNMDLTVYYASPGDDDHTAPTIRLSNGVVQGTDASFTVDATDDTGISRVVVLYQEPGQADWQNVDLAASETAPSGAQRWSGSTELSQAITAEQDVAYLVQVVDTSGNVGVSSAKALFHRATVPPPPPAEDGTGTLVISGTKSANWYVSDVQVSVEGDTDDDAAVYLDGEPANNDGFTISETGTHTVVLIDEGTTTTEYVLVDREGPSIEIHSPGDDDLLAKGGDVPVSVSVRDAGSGVDESSVSDHPDSVDTSTVGHGTLTVSASDRLGQSSSATSSYDVVELAGSIDPVGAGQTWTLDVIGTTNADGLQADWGDGNGFVAVDPSDVTIGSDRLTLAHSWTQAGVYTVQVRRNEGRAVSFEFVTVTETAPGTAHVQGNVEFWSPLGALASDPSVAGVAKVAFNAKYEEDGFTLTGQSQFNFRDGDLLFHSTGYDSLVVDGNELRLVGEGVANHNEGYRFLLVGIDNGRNALNPDRIRLRIWRVNSDGSNGAVVYDNGVTIGPDGSITYASTESNASDRITKGDISIKSA